MNPIIVVTGGTRGIGRAIVEKFAAEGFDIITCARNEQDLATLASDIQKLYPTISIYTQVVDVAHKEDVLAFAHTIHSLTNHVEILVNNAGVFLAGEIHTEPAGRLEMLLNTNLYSAYHLSRAIIPTMITHKRGHIFNICSVASMMAYPQGGSYSISKFAMYGMSKSLREELKPYGIRVTSILPGATLTDSWNGVDLPESRFIKSADVADTIWAAYKLSATAIVEEVVIRPQLGDI